MTEQEYRSKLLAINSANLAANIENVAINTDILERQKRHEYDNNKIIALLTELLEEQKNDS
jgi:hypothetical protein